ncbi:MAG: hypothetical protein ABWY63_14375 [Hyphomicrobiaceae bacterium]
MVLTVISLGAGVQSTTLALMAAQGEITPMPDCAIFADTGAEPSHIYDYLDWLESVLPFPVYRVQWQHGLTRNIEGSVKGGRFAGAPFFAMTPSGAAPLRRQCTREFKIQPIVRKVRDLVGIKPRSPGPRHVVVEQWLGISLDEMVRMKYSGTRWIEHRFPLIERQMRRRDCLKWMAEHGYPEPRRSACVYCPYHSNDEWRSIRDNDPAGWQEAIRIDALIRSNIRGVRDPIYVHRSLKPLAEVDLSTAAERGQMEFGFLQECEGMCGV